MVISDKIIEKYLDAMAIHMMPRATKSAISQKKKVGAIVMAWDSVLQSFRFFSGSNFWFSESFTADHAEQFAIKKALFARCYPVRIYVSSSTNYGKPQFLCGLYKEFVSSVNADCEIIVIRLDGTIKGRQILSEKFESKNFKMRNKFFIDLCYFEGLNL